VGFKQFVHGVASRYGSIGQLRMSLNAIGHLNCPSASILVHLTDWGRQSLGERCQQKLTTDAAHPAIHPSLAVLWAFNPFPPASQLAQREMVAAKICGCDPFSAPSSPAEPIAVCPNMKDASVAQPVDASVGIDAETFHIHQIIVLFANKRIASVALSPVCF
jgi:hypothetical protein